MEYDEASETFSQPCRCSGRYAITVSQMEKGVSLWLDSLSIKVIYAQDSTQYAVAVVHCVYEYFMK